MSRLGFLTSTCAVMAVLVAGSAHAQSPAPAEDHTAGTVEAVIVTAQKREENQQDVPIAVASVGAERLEALGVDTVMDIQIAVPSVFPTNANGRYSSTLRGVGSYAFSPGVESAVAIVIDGVYLAQPLASELALNNVDRIEVLKGPQGTLFGRNTTGGVINVITRTPTKDATGNFSLDYGNYDTVTGNAYISGGVEGLAADFAVRARAQGDGFGRNIITGADIGRTKYDVSLRSKVVWDIGPRTKLTVIGNYWTSDDSRGYVLGAPGTLSGFVNTTAAAPPTFTTTYPLNYVHPSLGFDVAQDNDYKRTGWLEGLSAKIDQDFEGVRLTAITAYRKGALRLQEDIDFTPFHVAALVDRENSSQFTQEVQLASTGDSRLKWTVGAFYFDMTSGYAPIDLDFVNFFGATIHQTVKHEAESWAAYAQSTYAVTDNTNLTLGVRYTEEKRKQADFVELDTFGPFTFPTVLADRSFTATKATYRVSLDHHFTDDIMGYVSVNTGFKSGGFNIGSPFDPPNSGIPAPAYKPETNTAYEAGLKTELFDHRLRLNAAAFYNDYKDLQVQKFNSTGSALLVVNGPSARIYGVDADFEAVLTDSIRVSGGFAWIDPKFGDFPGCPIATVGGGVPVVLGNCKGHSITFAPKFTGSLAVNYSTHVGAGVLDASANLYYNDGYFFEPDNLIKQDAFATLSASVKWTSDAGYYVGVFGDNLTDKRSLLSNGHQQNGNNSVSYADPRTYGVRVGYAF